MRTLLPQTETGGQSGEQLSRATECAPPPGGACSESIMNQLQKGEKKARRIKKNRLGRRRDVKKGRRCPVEARVSSTGKI